MNNTISESAARDFDAKNATNLASAVREIITGGAAETQTLSNKTLATEKHSNTAFVSDGAITFTTSLATLTKAGVGAYTLAAPATTDEGLILRIVSQTANAHVITATNLIDDGVTGGAKDTITFAAFVGASVTLQAINQKWCVLAINAVEIAAV